MRKADDLHLVLAQDTVAVAAIWRDTDELGAPYTMVMAEACVHVADVHDRMVVLPRDDWQQWVDRSPEKARAVCQAYSAAMTVDRTSETGKRG
ncbi:SOS response-associated peptidase family protein [Roseibium sp.]|uniref:SOS response-associated peptidase family protein n=1 Tax=Roseibium sp. TaxID=1936156 RepID=UPI003297D8F7